MLTWEALRHKLESTLGESDLQRLDRIYVFADQHHQGQLRLSGDPYMTHSLETTAILFDLHADPDTLAAGLLHDCLEDTSATLEQIQNEFGQAVADLVNGVTKISTRAFHDSTEQKAENLRKMMLAIVRDIRVIVIKLADRLHNMRTLEFLPPDKRERLARETLEIFAPLAHRLGMGRVKNELEDLAFSFLHPEEYQTLLPQLKNLQEQQDITIREMVRELERLLAESQISAQIQGRMKHCFSIWNKMRFQEKSLDEIYDLMALRILVSSVRDCYAALGIVHAQWKPMPGRFKDFIAMPKSNFYQSLHTTIITPSGKPLEIQIRTQEMHRTAEDGIAAHWSYKEGGKAGQAYEAKLSWLRHFLDWQQDMRDSNEFIEALKVDLFEDEVFVFTPKGEVKSLRRGANPIDYAYLIHSSLGDKLMGAKINGRLVPLKYELKNGDIVEIITRNDAHPSQDWLNMVKTSKAKNRIRHYFRQAQHDEMLNQGKAWLEAEVQRCGTSLADLVKKNLLSEAAQKMNFKQVEDLLIQIGDGNISARTVAAKLGLNPPSAPPAAVPEAEVSRPQPAGDDGIRVHGLVGMVTRFAQCCHPIPGDAIVGFITQGRGVSIHRKDCPNVVDLKTQSGRWVQVAWEEMQEVLHTLQVYVLAQEREKLLADLLQMLYESGAQVKATDTRSIRGHRVEGLFTLQIKDREHLQDILRKLNQVKGVLSVERK